MPENSVTQEDMVLYVSGKVGGIDTGAPSTHTHIESDITDLAHIGGFVPIVSATANNDATVDFTGIDGTYNSYMLVGSNVVPANDANTAFIRVSIAGSFKSGAADYGWIAFFMSGASNGNLIDLSDSEIQIGQTLGSAAGEGFSFHLHLPNPANITLYKNIYGTLANSNTSNEPVLFNFHGRYIAGTQAIDGLRFLFTGGNVESGEFTLYGMASA